MVSLRSPSGPDDGPWDRHAAARPQDWLTLPQAACEMGVSVSTVRRLLRKGQLRNRIVPRRGGLAYLIYLPGNGHSQGACVHLCNAIGHNRQPDDGERAEQEAEIRHLEDRVQALSHALSRALRIRPIESPTGIGDPADATDGPYARYRWLVRNRHWWPF